MLKQFFLSEKKMMIAIAVNALIICLLYFPSINSDTHPNYFLINLDHFFVVIFLIEAIVKLSAWSAKEYFKDGWNIFDFVIVVVSLPALLTFVPFFAAHNWSILKVLRLFRMIRLAKFMRFVPRMSMIMEGLVRALKSSVFVIVVLLFLNFILALFTCHFYGEVAPEYFRDPAISSYTIFQLFTVEGWNEISAVLAERTHSSWLAGLTRLYFVVVVMIGGIFGMSLANAIFVDEMTMDNNRELEDKIDGLFVEISELKKLIKNG